ncbi:MAG: alpha/beta hydrolase [Pirellulales bacterium]|nr:alpha/beta hydrolase [Pirellulales bacterium]
MIRSRWCPRGALAALFLLAPLTWARAADNEPRPYTQREDVVFGETDGVALVMDIFTPTGPANGIGIVDIASGAWHSDRGKISDHKTAQMYDIMCGRGFTVFAVRPGSQTKFSVPEMVAHIKTAIRWIKQRHEEFKIDPERLGLCGASAGGHLTCLTATTAEDGDANAQDEKHYSTRVAAAVAFFPPTDFGRWAGKEQQIDPESRIGKMLMKLLFAEGGAGKSAEEIAEQVVKISPARQVTSATPPILLIHGDADFVVPLVQSKIMLEALQAAGVESQLIIKKGGGHPWPTIHEEVRVATDWLEKHLVPQPEPAATN